MKLGRKMHERRWKKEIVFCWKIVKSQRFLIFMQILRREKIEDFRQALDVNSINFIADKILAP